MSVALCIEQRRERSPYLELTQERAFRDRPAAPGCASDAVGICTHCRRRFRNVTTDHQNPAVQSNGSRVRVAPARACLIGSLKEASNEKQYLQSNGGGARSQRGVVGGKPADSRATTAARKKPAGKPRQAKAEEREQGSEEAGTAPTTAGQTAAKGSETATTTAATAGQAAKGSAAARASEATTATAAG